MNPMIPHWIRPELLYLSMKKPGREISEFQRNFKKTPFFNPVLKSRAFFSGLLWSTKIQKTTDSIDLNTLYLPILSVSISSQGLEPKGLTLGVPNLTLTLIVRHSKKIFSKGFSILCRPVLNH